MPNTYIENRERWQDLADIDYLGQFVKAWLAFNAWYRGAYGETRDRAIIDEIKGAPNNLRSRIIPLLESDTEEAEQLRGFIGALHHRLENFHLEAGKGAEKHRITFTSVYLRENSEGEDAITSRGINYRITRGGSGVPQKQITAEVINKAGQNLFSTCQAKYDFAEIQTKVDSDAVLSSTQKRILVAHYRQASPNIIANLTDVNEGDIQCGAHTFRCSSSDLFAAVMEISYLMRCCLFHGELVPSREAASCYEPAYHIVRKFLSSLS